MLITECMYVFLHGKYLLYIKWNIEKSRTQVLIHFKSGNL